jgi:hypothetical protein
LGLFKFHNLVTHANGKLNFKTMEKTSTYGNGKICYLEIPAIDIDGSVAFYKTVFGWNIRTRGDGW